MAIIQTLSPGVYGFERTPQPAGVQFSPAKAAFVGWTDEGPSHTPFEIRSPQEFRRIFGGPTSKGVIPVQVDAFFSFGGQSCFVVRVVPGDAVAAKADVDAVPGPTKWTFESVGEGAYGNDTIVRVAGNLSFLDRTAGAEKWDKFDIIVLRPSLVDPSILESREKYEAVQFTDPNAADYILDVLNNPNAPSQFIRLLAGAGGVPSGLLSSQVADEVAVAGTAVNGTDVDFSGTLANPPVLDGTLRIVAAGAVIDDQAQSPTPDGATAGFNFTLAQSPVLDGSLRLFFQKAPAVVGEAPALAAGTVGVDTDYQIAAGALSAPVHRENTVFRIRFAKTAPSSPQTLVASVVGPAAYNLAATPLADTPIHPGTVSIAVDEDGVGPATITDDGNGNLVGSNGTILPGGGTIDYATGAMTGTTAPLTNASAVVATYAISGVITKAASTDNMDQAVALTGDVDGAGVNQIALVNSTTNPTGNGLIDFKTNSVPLSGTAILVDFMPLGIVNSDLAGNLSGDVQAATGTFTNTADFTTGAVSVNLAAPPPTGSTIDADYSTGQVAQDNGLGQLVGSVDPAGTNTIDYQTGAWQVRWASPPPAGQPIYANYVKLAQFLDFQLSGGSDGSALARSDISATALEPQKKGIYALDDVPEPLNVALPDFDGSQFVQFDLIQFARERADSRFVILAAANGTTVDEAIQYVQVTQAWDEKVAAFYYPNIYMRNPETQKPELISVSGAVAGIYSRTAHRKNVGKTPAGVEDGLLDAPAFVGPERILDLTERDKLYQSRINPLFQNAAGLTMVWGARTLSKDIRWRYINTRLLHNFLMFNVAQRLEWAVFENNGPSLWMRMQATISSYLGSLFRLGYFGGNTEEEAYSVVSDGSNNNAATVAEGKAIIDVGFTAGTPAEFVIFSLAQPVGQTAS